MTSRKPARDLWKEISWGPSKTLFCFKSPGTLDFQISGEFLYLQSKNPYAPSHWRMAGEIAFLVSISPNIGPSLWTRVAQGDLYLGEQMLQLPHPPDRMFLCRLTFKKWHKRMNVTYRPGRLAT
jgi:hypothetical protein